MLLFKWRRTDARPFSPQNNYVRDTKFPSLQKKTLPSQQHSLWMRIYRSLHSVPGSAKRKHSTQIDNTATSYNDEQKIPTFPGSLIFPCTAKWTRSHAKQPCRAGKIFHQTSYSGNSRIIPKCFKLHVKHASRSLVILLKPKTQDGELKKRDSCCSDKRKCTIYSLFTTSK